ncbi:hypothetical protein B0T13DRAFT_520613 [Neurospora crassa]|nr:hypothetical protein B0T13DRAFT_275331 [Neurospora crassa]KAK3488229.1 hypothetical protein B0T13DRAFT_520613 [Neurospora crassa]
MDSHSPFASTTTNSSHNNSTSNLHNNPSTTSSSITNVGHSNFTPEMRDKQARGKDPYAERSDEESDFDGGGPAVGMMGRSMGAGGGVGGRVLGRGTGRGGAGGLSWGERKEVRRKVEISGNAKALSSMSNSNHHVDYDTREKRRKASMFLNDPELLITHAEASGMTIAGSRHHFMLMLCGYDNKPRKKSAQGSSSVSSGPSSRMYQGVPRREAGWEFGWEEE